MCLDGGTAGHASVSGGTRNAPETPATALYFIGYAQLTLCELGPGESFGESAILEDATYAVGAIALEEVLLIAVRRSVFVAYAERHPATAFRLAVAQTQRLATANQQLGDMALSTVETRVARTLRRLAERDGVAVSAGLLLRRRVTHLELAHRAGSSRQTVTRTTAALARAGSWSSTRDK